MTVPGRDWTAGQLIDHLRSMENAADIAGMARFGIDTATALGISNTELRAIGRKAGRDHGRALELWQSGIREARLLAAFTAEPRKLTADTARDWAAAFNSWEIVDGVADLFAEARLHDPLIEEFSADDREFVRRTAFAMMAWSAVHMKAEPDATFLRWLERVGAIRSHSVGSSGVGWSTGRCRAYNDVRPSRPVDQPARFSQPEGPGIFPPGSEAVGLDVPSGMPCANRL